MNRLYYGDNLQVLRDHIADESVDLTYLDPPFNSNASYSILFKSPEGQGADAQIEAFEDTWTWGPASDEALMDGQTETGVISVKAGQNINPSMVRDLGDVMTTGGHKLGLFVTAAMPTRGIEEHAASKGLIETEFGRFPALQIFTLAELFQDRRPKLPPLVSPNRRAPKVETRASHQKGSQGSLI